MVASHNVPMAAFNLRPGKPEDAAACGQICYEAFKVIAENHNFPPDFPSVGAAVGLMSSILGKPGVYSVVAESDKRILGSNFLWEDTIAGVGPITVDPAVQNGSLGRRMMQDVLDYSRRKGFSGVRLVQAGYHSRSLSLYAKLGFVVREPLATMQGTPLGEKVAGCEVRLALERDIDACNAVCFKVHGHARAIELLDAVRQGVATVVVRDGRITGYATLIGFSVTPCQRRMKI
jgi:predicted N-acetyltransferase YhbS